MQSYHKKKRKSTSPMVVACLWLHEWKSVSKIEVFNALQMRLALQNIPLSKQPFQTQPQTENEDIT